MKLSRREIIMLTVLAIIALIFVEVQLLITPALNKIESLSAQLVQLQAEYETINFNLMVAETSRKNRDKNLEEIRTLSEPYLDGVTADALLVFTHEMIVKHGLIPYSYSPSPINSELLQPEQAVVSELNYKLKELAQQYQLLNGDGSTPEGEDGGATDGADADAANEDIVELYTLQVSANGTYDQIKAMLDDFDSLGKTILISNINMTPSMGGGGQLDIAFSINYYGIAKLEPGDDTINDWTREPFQSGVQDPFVSSAAPTPSETVPEETTTGG